MNDTTQSPYEKGYPVSWDQLHRDARALAWRLAEHDFQAMVCITRGGLVPAAIVSRELGIRTIETVCIVSYDHKAQGDLQILKHINRRMLESFPEGEGLLIVDDLADTGKTIRLIREMVPKAHVATVYTKPAGRPLVDTYVTEVSQDTWVYFPWDLSLQFAQPINRAGL